MQKVNSLCTNSGPLRAECCMVAFHTIRPSSSSSVLWHYLYYSRWVLSARRASTAPYKCTVVSQTTSLLAGLFQLSVTYFRNLNKTIYTWRTMMFINIEWSTSHRQWQVTVRSRKCQTFDTSVNFQTITATLRRRNHLLLISSIVTLWFL